MRKRRWGAEAVGAAAVAAAAVGFQKHVRRSAVYIYINP